jgi:hypothetical protein
MKAGKISRLAEVRWIDLPSNRDSRGILTAVEAGRDIPFPIRRIFYMHHIATDRGGHAHTDTDQVIIAAAGRFKMDLADGVRSRTFTLHDATRGLYVPRMIFIKIFQCSRDAVCLVLANRHYSISRSIRSWEEYDARAARGR